MKTQIHKIKSDSSTIKTTKEALLSLGVSEKEIVDGRKHFEIQSIGCWGIIKSIKGIVHSTDFNGNHTIVSIRTMYNCKQNGYDVDGHVSIAGKKYSAFTSSTLFELEDGKLVDCATIFARNLI